MKELVLNLKENWLLWLIVASVLAVTFIWWLHSPLYHETLAVNEMNNKATAILKYQFGVLSQEEKDWVTKKYGMTEEDFNPLRQYINAKNN